MCLNHSEIGTGTHGNFKFGKNIHNYLNNQEMSGILRYFKIFWFFILIKGSLNKH